MSGRQQCSSGCPGAPDGEQVVPLPSGRNLDWAGGVIHTGTAVVFCRWVGGTAVEFDGVVADPPTVPMVEIPPAMVPPVEGLLIAYCACSSDVTTDPRQGGCPLHQPRSAKKTASTRNNYRTVSLTGCNGSPVSWMGQKFRVDGSTPPSTA